MTFVAGAPLTDNLAAFARFAVVTSLGWDVLRGVTLETGEALTEDGTVGEATVGIGAFGQQAASARVSGHRAARGGFSMSLQASRATNDFAYRRPTFRGWLRERQVNAAQFRSERRRSLSGRRRAIDVLVLVLAAFVVHVLVCLLPACVAALTAERSWQRNSGRRTLLR